MALTYPKNAARHYAPSTCQRLRRQCSTERLPQQSPPNRPCSAQHRSGARASSTRKSESSARVRVDGACVSTRMSECGEAWVCHRAGDTYSWWWVQRLGILLIRNFCRSHTLTLAKDRTNTHLVLHLVELLRYLLENVLLFVQQCRLQLQLQPRMHLRVQ